MFGNHLFITFALYFILSAIIIISRPKFIFNNQHLRKFGSGNSKTLLPLWLVLIIVAILSYILSILIYLKIN